MVGFLVLLAALAIALKAVSVRRAESALAQRLVPVRARVIRRGDVPETRYVERTDSDGQPETRQETAYSGAWEYTVAGQRHEGGIESGAPVFTAAQMPPATIEVFYDRDDPSVSRLYRAADSALVRAWFIFAAVTAVVGLGIMVISAGNP
jgi:hypothetical protein